MRSTQFSISLCDKPLVPFVFLLDPMSVLTPCRGYRGRRWVSLPGQATLVAPSLPSVMSAFHTAGASSGRYVTSRLKLEDAACNGSETGTGEKSALHTSAAILAIGVRAVLQSAGGITGIRTACFEAPVWPDRWPAARSHQTRKRQERKCAAPAALAFSSRRAARPRGVPAAKPDAPRSADAAPPSARRA